MNLTSIPQIRALLKENGVAPIKKLGQNFMIDGNVADKIAAAARLAIDDDVLEIGPGLGALTQRIGRACGRVAAVEIDGGMVRILAKTLRDCPNASVIHADIMKYNLGELPFSRYHVVANLPYYITTPVILKLLGETAVESMTLLVQKEVGERLSAAPGGKEYGALTIAAQYAADSALLFKVPPTCFYPVPAVDSAVIRLTPKRREKRPNDEALFFEIARAAFSMRRKTLANNLCRLGIDRGECAKVLEDLGLKRDIRGEALSVEQFIELSDAVGSILRARD